MPDLINILPDSVANQIAAGEVVDRPASAVKELLENALDAGATKIQLFVKDAGRTLIQVVDNGCGMSPADARLCFERHATSKIHKADDLFAIHTMGFRGEALASIAAIAQVELRTRPDNKDDEKNTTGGSPDGLGTLITIEGSHIVDQTQCACPVGTSIAVKNLFFNIPARRNFLKRDSIELGHIEEVFKRVALVNHHVAYTFHAGTRPLYDLRAGTFAERIAQMFGQNIREKLVPVDEDTEIAVIHGYVSKPEYARRSRGEQYLFVNNRYIKHPALSAAVEKAYTDLIPEYYYPSYFLHIHVDPSRIDINIHPTKTEVKFIDEQPLFAILRAATKRAIGQFGIAAELPFDTPPELDFTPAPKGYTPPAPTVHYNPDYNPFSQSSHTSKADTDTRWKTFFEDTTPDTPTEPASSQFSILNSQFSISNTGHCLLTADGHYIVSTMPSGILLVDIAAAHERILYERLVSTRKNTTSPQQLLFPANCTFSPSDADIFSELLPDLKERGFEVSPLGGQTFVVTATPPEVRDTEVQAIFDQMLSEYKSSMLQKFNDRTQCLCRSLARQMALKSGTALQQHEMQQLVADLFCCQMPHTSPSGKKTLAIIPPDKLLN